MTLLLTTRSGREGGRPFLPRTGRPGSAYNYNCRGKVGSAHNGNKNVNLWGRKRTSFGSAGIHTYTGMVTKVASIGCVNSPPGQRKPGSVIAQPRGRLIDNPCTFMLTTLKRQIITKPPSFLPLLLPFQTALVALALSASFLLQGSSAAWRDRRHHRRKTQATTYTKSRNFSSSVVFSFESLREDVDPTG